MNKYYTITTPYNATYNLIDENGMIYLGGSKYYCISVGLNNNGDDLFIKSDKECVLHNNYPNIKIGDDMMYALLYYLKTIYKICEFSFNDKSSDKIYGSLPIYSLAFFQKTWYENKFGATLKNNTIKMIYEKTKLNFYSNTFKKDKRDLLTILLKSKNNDTSIMQIYDKVDTIKDFFDIIKEKIESKEIDFKKIIQSWLEDFIRVEMGFNFLFNFDIKWKIQCNQSIKKEDEYMLNLLNENPFPKYKNRYMKIHQKEFYKKQFGGMRQLCDRERELFNDPRWIGWLKIDEFNPKDKKYLHNLRHDMSEGKW